MLCMEKVSRKSLSLLKLESCGQAGDCPAAKDMSHFPGAGVQERCFPYQPV